MKVFNCIVVILILFCGYCQWVREYTIKHRPILVYAPETIVEIIPQGDSCTFVMGGQTKWVVQKQTHREIFNTRDYGEGDCIRCGHRWNCGGDNGLSDSN